MKTPRLASLTAAAALALSAGLAHAQIVITTNTTIAPGDPVYAGQDVIVRGCTVTINGAQSFGSLTIERNESNAPGVVTHSPTFSSGGVNGMYITLAGDLVIQGAAKGLVASRIDVNAKGFPKGQGPGTAPEVFMGSGRNPAGGSYGGEGGIGSNTSTDFLDWSFFLPGACNGSLIAPTSHGSGSGTVTIIGNVHGSAGGGAVLLVVGGNALINGSITSDGEGGVAGGSGGSIFLQCNDLSGSGALRAQGGVALGTLTGGGGGGGRISVISNTSSFAGTMSASGGDTQRNAAPTGSGGAGTLYLHNGASQPQVIIDNAGSGVSPAYGATQLEGEVTTDADVVVRNNARVGPRRDSTTALHWTINGSLSIDATSLVGAAGRGPRPAPAGNGGFGSSGSNITGGGGGHGGAGGHGRNPGGILGFGGPVHGDANAPTSFGGAGGSVDNSSTSSWGGGAFRLTTSGPITLNGSISADGATRAPEDQIPLAGGGAGGSVWIEAPSISGAGFIGARGGNAGSMGGGGGGGGRIRVDACTLGIALANMSVEGGAASGAGADPGQPGTIVTATPATDWNGDGVVNSTDVSDFINDWFTDQAKGSLTTDFNHDGVSNSTDVSDFINAWFEQEPLC